MTKEKNMDKKAELLKEMQEELDRRTEVENQAILLISEGRCQEAVELLASLDNSVIEMLSAEYEVLEEMEKYSAKPEIKQSVEIVGEPAAPEQLAETILKYCEAAGYTIGEVIKVELRISSAVTSNMNKNKQIKFNASDI